jgi:hypothetical protein
MLYKIALLFSVVFCEFRYDYSDYKLSTSFLNASQIKPSKSNVYISQILDYNLLRPVIDTLNSSYGPLNGTGEAHITVISPPEFKYGLSSVLTMQEIKDLAISENLQSLPFEIICLARQSQFDKNLGKRSSVYNLIVKTEGLFTFRSKVFDLYLSYGGDPSNFNPTAYYRKFYLTHLAHITLGFEEHGDWFTQDLVFKTDMTCIYPIEFTD